MTVESLRAGNAMMEEVIESKLLDFNLSKSCCLVIGKNKPKQKLIKEISESEIKLCGKEIQIAESEKWLGDYLHSDGNSQSIIKTVKARYGLALSTIIDIKNIIEDVRATVLGGIMTGIEMYEMCVVPFILNNCDTWDNIPREAMEMLNKLENTFYCSLLGTPRKGTPQPSLLWETGQTSLKFKIMEKKINFYHHVMTMDDQCLAKIMAKKQIENNYPGLMMECHDILDQIGLRHCHPCHFSKMSWKKMTKMTIKEHNRSHLLEKIKTYKKLDYFQLKEEEFEPKSYLRNLNIHDARMKYRTRINLVPGLKFHYKSDKRFRESMWSCPLCEKLGDNYNLDNLSHTLACPFLADLREQRDLEDDRQLCEYVREALRRREDVSIDK